VAELSSAFRADVNVIDLEQALHSLPAASIVMDQRLFFEVARVTFKAYFARMKARRRAMMANVEPLEKSSAQHADISQFFEDASRVADPEQ
jgi:hypothetical protein